MPNRIDNLSEKVAQLNHILSEHDGEN
jgi:hypothetical protein